MACYIASSWTWIRTFGTWMVVMTSNAGLQACSFPAREKHRPEGLRYVELHASSAFSFLEGAALPEDFVERCVELGAPAMALLDRDGVYGAARFHMAAANKEQNQFLT